MRGAWEPLPATLPPPPCGEVDATRAASRVGWGAEQSAPTRNRCAISLARWRYQPPRGGGWTLIFLYALIAIVVSPLTGARAQDLVSGISQDEVQINSSYAGTSIVVFGAVQDSNAPATQNDIVVVVRGPNSDLTVRRKARIAGIWINRDQMKLYGMPGYYFVASSRALDKIATPQTLARYQIGLAYLAPERMGTHVHAKGEPFRLAAIGEHARDGLYQQSESVELLSYSLFRVQVPIPATVPRGQYTVEAYLFRDGTVTSAQSTPLYVDQQGLERRLYRYAHASALVYGVSTVLMAMFLGWLSSLLIRQQR